MNAQTLIATLLIATALLAATAGAHERRVYDIGGTHYLIIVGSVGEPILTGEKTSLDLRIKLADPADPTNSSAAGSIPVTGLEETLEVELIAGDERRMSALEAAYKDPGAYRAYFIPTGHQITYRLVGRIGETPIDLLFPCSGEGHHMSGMIANEPLAAEGEGVIRTFKAGAFGCPTPREEVEFPAAGAAMAHGVDPMLTPEHHQLMMDSIADQAETIKRTETFAFAGMIAGALALLVGGFALARRH